MISVVGAFDELSVEEGGSGADERDQVRAFTQRHRVWVDSISLNAIATPAAAAGAFDDALAEPDGR